jgi:dTMP kinase
MKGKLIIFEGGEGAGKSLQLKILHESLIKNGIDTLLTREPGGTPLAEKIRDIVKGHDDQFEQMTDTTELFLMNSARAQHVAHKIIPAINSGKIVLCDRFTFSTLAYQGYGRGIDLETVRLLNDVACQGLQPDLVIYLSIDPSVGMERARGRAALDRIEVAGDEFMANVQKGLDEEISKFKGRKIVINAESSIEDISKVIHDFVMHELKLSKDKHEFEPAF